MDPMNVRMAREIEERTRDVREDIAEHAQTVVFAMFLQTAPDNIEGRVDCRTKEYADGIERVFLAFAEVIGRAKSVNGVKCSYSVVRGPIKNKPGFAESVALVTKRVRSVGGA